MKTNQVRFLGLILVLLAVVICSLADSKESASTGLNPKVDVTTNSSKGAGGSNLETNSTEDDKGKEKGGQDDKSKESIADDVNKNKMGSQSGSKDNDNAKEGKDNSSEESQAKKGDHSKKEDSGSGVESKDLSKQKNDKGDTQSRKEGPRVEECDQSNKCTDEENKLVACLRVLVVDPLLAQHLAFFGIDFSALQKTEMTTAERELDQNTNYDWNRIQESGQDVEPIFGPGYTGLVNLGNSCYMAATMQVVFSTRSFNSRFYINQSLKMAFEMAPADPTVDLNMQLTKLAHGMLSGKYSVPALENDDKANAVTSTSNKQEGIPPRMFKAVIAASHPEFSSMRQQDALEFFLHFLDQVERVNGGKPALDPSRSFKFGIEERILCPSGKVGFNRRLDYILSLNIPLDEATNKEELEAFSKLKAEKTSEGKDLSSDEIVRPRVPLEACLANFSAPEEIQDYYSTALKAKTTALKTAGLTSFPDYLVLHMRKFVLEEGWVPKKLDVYIDVPDIIDISYMRSKGLQPGEELLPDDVPEAEVESNMPLANEDIVSQLVSMGFNYLHCQKAAINSSNAGVEEAMNWLLSHMDDPDIDAPVSQGAHGNEVMDQLKVDTLLSFGFQEEIARKALKASGGDIEKATDWIFNNPDASVSSDMETSTSSSKPAPDDTELPDGGGKYKLFGIVSHMGTSTHCGHYVAHILKDGRWAIFNDSKVAVSVNLPKDMGYLYFFERLDS